MGEWLNHHNFDREHYVSLDDWQDALGLLPESSRHPKAKVKKSDEIAKAKGNFAKVMEAFSK